ncbi:MAG: GtrA family protein [Polyangiaceae bacterium]
MVAFGACVLWAHRRPSSPSTAHRELFGRGSALRNLVAGFVATGADFILALGLVGVAQVAPAWATLGGCALGAVVNFTVNRTWTFGSRAPKSLQAVRYGWVSASSALFNAALVSVLLLPSVPFAAAWIGVRAAVFFGWNYPLHRDYVFAPGPGAVAT